MEDRIQVQHPLHSPTPPPTMLYGEHELEEEPCLEQEQERVLPVEVALLIIYLVAALVVDTNAEGDSCRMGQ
ncbi:hypothetical protein pdam_00002753 [Pocillopora damicornis]|uniref:Uncharacterized protein n=1 Tax=Pocillopora damicornis TaxID=46731 RepID=A0A3M6TTM4_POCDA|nr:hypothetical protein pdam_00002753 [Pocillopora damicornis]